MTKRIILSILCLTLIASVTPALAEQSPIRAIRFDPGYYYDHPESNDVQALADQLCGQWAQNGVNTIYYMAYSTDGGARYDTNYSLNSMEDFGAQDLLGQILPAAHARDMKVVAWFFDRTHRQAWEQNPTWRVKDAHGNDYKPRPEDFFLSPSSPEAMRWWLGMLEDLMDRYTDLDGMDIAEPLLNWWGNTAGFHPNSVQLFNRLFPDSTFQCVEWLNFRAAVLTRHLVRSIELIQSFGLSAHLTVILTADSSGRLISNDYLKFYTGLDLDGVLDSTSAPDYVNAELIWQQWKNEHGAGLFNPKWTGWATRQATKRMAGRSALVVHVEESTFGNVTPRKGDLAAALKAARDAGATHLDCYDTHLLDQKLRWSEIAENYNPATGIPIAGMTTDPIL